MTPLQMINPNYRNHINLNDYGLEKNLDFLAGMFINADFQDAKQFFQKNEGSLASKTDERGLESFITNIRPPSYCQHFALQVRHHQDEIRYAASYMDRQDGGNTDRIAEVVMPYTPDNHALVAELFMKHFGTDLDSIPAGSMAAYYRRCPVETRV